MKKLLTIFLVLAICITSMVPVMGIENIDVLQNLEPVSASTNLDEILLDYHKNVDIIQKGLSNTFPISP